VLDELAKKWREEVAAEDIACWVPRPPNVSTHQRSIGGIDPAN